MPYANWPTAAWMIGILALVIGTLKDGCYETFGVLGANCVVGAGSTCAAVAAAVGVAASKGSD